MGWWKIASVESGGISCDMPTGHPGGTALRNAIPGRDAPDDNYNGDRTADIMGAAIKRIDDEYRRVWGRPAHPDEMKACFNFMFNGWCKRQQHDA